MDEGEESERPDQAALEAVGREIDQETDAIADLRRRTHTLEIEIAAWRREPWRPRTRGGGPAEPMDRVEEMAMGLFLGAVGGTIFYKLLALLSGGRG